MQKKTQTNPKIETQHTKAILVKKDRFQLRSKCGEREEKKIAARQKLSTATQHKVQRGITASFP